MTMKNTSVKRSFLIIALMHVFALTCLSQVSLSFDLYKLTLNGLNMQDLTVDKVTDILGRPSASESNQMIADALGPKVLYHNKGVTFWFKSKQKDPLQKVFLITLYLVRTWDKDYNDFYMPFSGHITPNITPNQKESSISQLFKNYDVTIQSAEENRKEREKLFKELNISTNVSENNQDFVRIKNKNGLVIISCEGVTKFIEKLSITFE